MASHASPQYTTLVCDIGDVLFTWTPPAASKLSRKALFSSAAWHDYECGRINDGDVFCEAVSRETGLTKADVEGFYAEARPTLHVNEELLAIIRDIKARQFQVLLMSNISSPDFEDLLTRFDDWAVFDGVFISAEVGLCKPEIGFYEHVIAESGIDPRKSVFLDDKAKNTDAAASLGFRDVVYDDMAHVAHTLRSLFRD
ncbi:HAD-like protein [Coniophora puteana RWD-64-598 SS2]|uniref:HAD-like protein n=1 Tax=Coniophora puteana (strain RWD-64-598) TaxID=741705 RepID=A0A5M3N822_CONPW|nr:HAD-like protein [Coniophora puteana RWD-64-598 SS2]EIW87254.1 HAD-like protein [Coniophora puteana RWD-64-598 SS2]